MATVSENRRGKLDELKTTGRRTQGAEEDSRRQGARAGEEVESRDPRGNRRNRTQDPRCGLDRHRPRRAARLARRERRGHPAHGGHRHAHARGGQRGA